MKVLVWIEAFWPHIGGAEVFAAHLMQAMETMGYEFQIITSWSPYAPEEEDFFEGIPMRRIRFKEAVESQDLRQVMMIRKQITELKKEIRPDLVHLHLYGPSPFFHWTTQSTHPSPTLVTLHSNTQNFFSLSETSGFTNSIRKSDWFNTVSNFQLKIVRQFIPDVTERSSYIYNGIPAPTTQPKPLPTPGRLLCLGRLVEWKGFDTALYALARIRHQHPDVRMSIAGDGVDRQQLEQITSDLKLEDIVDFVGWVAPNDVPDFINQHSIVLMPSHGDENLPLVSTQAGQMARPVIASDTSGYPEVITDDETGILVEIGDIEGFADALDTLLNDPPLAQKMGTAAYNKVHQQFDMQRCAENYHSLYQRLITEFRANGTG